ncbi:MAG: metallophosphoesterase family protein [Pseudomonadota bacterium]
MDQPTEPAAVDITNALGGADRLLVFGGPYSNLEALDALIAQANVHDIEPSAVICTGDLAAYCANPAEVIARVRDWGCHVVAGNCEVQLAQGADDCGCGFGDGSACDLLSRQWYTFASGRVDEPARMWLGSLPRAATFTFAGERFRVIHGGHRQMNRFIFASDTDAIDEELSEIPEDHVIAGHSGRPFITLRDRARLWFNAGVIGMPANDGSPQTWYGMLSRSAGGLVASTHPLTYDATTASAKRAATGTSLPYAEALVTGRWPSEDILPLPERECAGQPLSPATVVLPRVAQAGHAAAE